MGALGVAIGARTKRIKLLPVMDAMAPGVLVAQALGRLGNYFNQELFGRPTDLPWALEIDVAHRPAGYLDEPTFHPTFLYESLWCLAAAVVLIWADRRFRLGHGRVVALYVMAYTAGRVWIEMLRIDSVQLDNVLGPALERLDLDHPVRPGAGVLPLVAQGAPRPGDVGLPSRGRRDDAAETNDRRQGRRRSVVPTDRSLRVAVDPRGRVYPLRWRLSDRLRAV